MNSKQKNIHATGLALALTFFVISLICLLLFFVSPVFTLNIFGSFMHGIDLNKIAVAPDFNGKTVLGFIVILVGGYLIGVFYQLIYNKFAK
ncbi:hypothetical protein J4221_02185 [Candidatus Pacearchaeota archaeon]|nr:hypothetical protein [Candidatus Pacearchaeota archaeon]